MHVYCAAVYTNSYMRGQNRYLKLTPHEQEIVHKVPNILESYHYVDKQNKVDEMRREGAKVFLDSGAFSAWTLGTVVDLPEYCNYINRNRDILRVEDSSVMASVLDAIGDAQGTYINQKHMEYLGAKPLPCFHKGEDERWLMQYLEDGYEYITIGGMVGSSVAQLQIWLDRIWDRYLAPGGKPLLKVHGFGLTSVTLMQRYPWYSCDSSSWIQMAAFGNIMWVQDPVIRSTPLKVSDKSPSKHDAGQHITTLSPIETEYLFQQLEAQGFTYERLSTVYESRAAYNLWAFGVINKMIDAAHDNQFKARVQELF
jgi:hypothetical protein